MAHARLRPRLLVEEPQVGARWDVERRSRVNLSALAYERIEGLIADRELWLGSLLMVQDLQNHTRSGTVDRHIEVLEDIASRNVTAAMEATDALKCLDDRPFDALVQEISPAQLDCGVSPNFLT